MPPGRANATTPLRCALAFESVNCFMRFEFYRQVASQHGLRAAAYNVAYRAANKLTELMILDGVTVSLATLDKKFLEEPKAKEGRFLDFATLKRLARNPELMLTERFIAQAEAKGDRCYGFLEGELLSSYGWYSTKPTLLTEVRDDLVIHFNPTYAYMYNGFTHPKFRGQRLHAIGMAKALEALTGEGLDGLVSYVDSANFASLKSCFRMGYQTFGHVALVKVGDRFRSYASPGCTRYGFRVEVRRT